MKESDLPKMYFFPSRALPLLLFAFVLNAQTPDRPQTPPPASEPPTSDAQVPPATTQPGAPQPDVPQPQDSQKDATPTGTPPDNSATPPANPSPTAPADTNNPPEVIPADTPPGVAPESTGPGILSRPFTVTPLENQDLRFRPFFTISGLTDSGLTQIVPQTGQITTGQSYGIQGGFGISGRRVHRKDTLELEFRGDIYHYTPNNSFDGGNYLLNLTYRHYFTRHISVALSESASLYSNNYSLLNSAADLSVAGAQTGVSPNLQLFDNRTLSLSTGVDVVVQKTSRLSFDFGGTGFLVRRESSSLYGTIGSRPART